MCSISYMKKQCVGMPSKGAVVHEKYTHSYEMVFIQYL